MATATLSVPENCEKEGCFLVSFTNGQLQPSAASQPRFSLYHKGGPATKKRKILVAETDQLTYVGTNYEDGIQSSAASLCKYYVGALDKNSGVMTLHRAELINLRPYIPGKTDIDLNEESSEKLDRAQVQDEMVSLFGSERQKRAFAAYKRNKVGSEALETALATAVSQAGSSQESVVGDSLLIQGSGVAPPHNPQAQSPQDVYDINDIISLEDLKSVQVTAKVFTSATTADVARWREEKRYPAYILQHVLGLPQSEPRRSLKAAVLLYVNWLIQLYTSNPKDFQRNGLKLVGTGPSSEVERHMLDKFSEPSAGVPRKAGAKVPRRLSNKMKDKIVLHMFVLCLILDDFSVDCSALQQDLKLTTRKLMDNFKALGCRVTKLGLKRKTEDSWDGATVDTTSCSATLQIPLMFPKRKKGPKRN